MITEYCLDGLNLQELSTEINQQQARTAALAVFASHLHLLCAVCIWTWCGKSRISKTQFSSFVGHTFCCFHVSVSASHWRRFVILALSFWLISSRTSPAVKFCLNWCVVFVKFNRRVARRSQLLIWPDYKLIESWWSHIRSQTFERWYWSTIIASDAIAEY